MVILCCKCCLQYKFFSVKDILRVVSSANDSVRVDSDVNDIVKVV